MVKTVGELVDMLRHVDYGAEICAFDPEGQTFYIKERMWIESDNSGVILYLEKVKI